MKIYRLTILGQGTRDQIVLHESSLSRIVLEFNRVQKMASATAARIERTSVQKLSKALFLNALNQQSLGLKFETVMEWDRVNGTQDY